MKSKRGRCWIVPFRLIDGALNHDGSAGILTSYDREFSFFSTLGRKIQIWQVGVARAQQRSRSLRVSLASRASRMKSRNKILGRHVSLARKREKNENIVGIIVVINYIYNDIIFHFIYKTAQITWNSLYHIVFSLVFPLLGLAWFFCVWRWSRASFPT